VKNPSAIRLLFTANAISGFAQGISMLAIPWYFSKILGKPELFGWMYAITTFVMLFWGMYAGSLIDHYSRKAVFLIVNIFGAVLLGGISALGFYLGYVPDWGAVTVFAGTMLIYNIHFPALYAFGQEISESSDYGRFTSRAEIIGQSVSIGSGAIAAIMLSGLTAGTHAFMGAAIHIPYGFNAWSLQEIFLLDAITYLIGILLIAKIRYKPVASRYHEAGSFVTRMKSGFEFLQQHPLLFLFGNASYAIFVVLLVTVQQLLPVYIDQHLSAGAGLYAFAEVLYSIGALLAGVAIIWIFRRFNFVLGIILLMFAAIVIYLISAFNHNVILFAVITLFLGISNAGARVLRTTWLFNHVPNQKIGRISSVFQTINILFRVMISAIFSFSFFNRNDNIRYAYLLCAVFVAIAVIPMMLNYRKLVNFRIPAEKSGDTIVPANDQLI
jgi:MFS family permease